MKIFNKKIDMRLQLYRLSVFLLFITPLTLSKSYGEYVSNLYVVLSGIWLVCTSSFSLAGRIKNTKTMLFSLIVPCIFLIIGIMSYSDMLRKLMEKIINL